MARPECHILKGAAILAKRNLALGTAVQIVKNCFRHSATRQRPEILDANNPGGCDFAGRSRSHFKSRSMRPENLGKQAPCQTVEHLSFAKTSCGRQVVDQSALMQPSFQLDDLPPTPPASASPLPLWRPPPLGPRESG